MRERYIKSIQLLPDTCQCIFVVNAIWLLNNFCIYRFVSMRNFNGSADIILPLGSISCAQSIRTDSQ